MISYLINRLSAFRFALENKDKLHCIHESVSQGDTYETKTTCISHEANFD